MKHYPVKSCLLSFGETMAYRESGCGETLLLLHGNMSSSVHFQTLMENLENKYHVVAIDLMGFGDSDYQKKRLHLQDYAKDVAEFLQKLNITSCSVLGWSTGGGIALELAAILPDVIKRVFLLASVGLQGFKMYHKDPSKNAALMSEYEDIANDPIQVVPVLEAYRTGNKALLKYICDATLYNLNQPSEEEYDAYLEAILKQRNLVDIDYALVHFNMTHSSNGVNEATGRIDLVKCPVVLIHGDKDLVVHIQESINTKELLKEQANLHIIEGSGHSVVSDDLQSLVQIINNYI